ncbi:MAG: 4a-hydroxytetrahydrobiopterin dehydratase [Miltoncostaeaceae bacterium]
MLNDEQITAALAGLPGWEREGDALVRRITGPGGFWYAFAFARRLAVAADRVDHHPDVSISWNRVTVSWSSHSAGGITERDVEMAAATDALVPTD